MSRSFRPCAVIPTYDNPRTVGAVVDAVRQHLLDVIVVDDGSAEPGRSAVERLGADGSATTLRRSQNGGKGAAVKTGFEEAHRRGFSHVLQVDADGQHDLTDIPRFLKAAEERPDALILGQPVFDESQPRGRSFARQISVFWVGVEVGGRIIADPQCGFRVYPLAAARAARPRGNHMQFDQELPVRMVWGGTPVENLPTRVRYLTPQEGGVSHFQLLRDNLRISACHSRLVCTAALRVISRGFTTARAGPGRA